MRSVALAESISALAYTDLHGLYLKVVYGWLDDRVRPYKGLVCVIAGELRRRRRATKPPFYRVGLPTRSQQVAKSVRRYMREHPTEVARITAKGQEDER